MLPSWITGEEQEEHTDESGPAVEVDMRLFSVYVEGAPADELSDVEEIANEQVEKRLSEVKDLKRHDQELAKEFDEGEPASARRHTQ